MSSARQTGVKLLMSFESRASTVVECGRQRISTVVECGRQQKKRTRKGETLPWTEAVTKKPRVLNTLERSPPNPRRMRWSSTTVQNVSTYLLKLPSGEREFWLAKIGIRDTSHLQLVHAVVSELYRQQGLQIISGFTTMRDLPDLAVLYQVLDGRLSRPALFYLHEMLQQRTRGAD